MSTDEEILAPQSAELPHAVPGPVTAPFWDGCRRGELLFQRCGRCGAATFPPVEHCRGCQAFELCWERSAGAGTVYSWTVVSRPVTPAFVAPYAPAIVALAEGYQMVSNIIGARVAELRVDLPVHVDFRQAGAIWLPYFRPA